MLLLKNAKKSVAAVKACVHHSKPSWPEKMINSLVLSLKRVIGFLFVVYCSVGKSQVFFFYAQKSEKEEFASGSISISPGR